MANASAVQKNQLNKMRNVKHAYKKEEEVRRGKKNRGSHSRQAHVATVGRRDCSWKLELELEQQRWRHRHRLCRCCPSSIWPGPVRARILVWLELAWLPLASILNCYALDNLNTRRRKNKTQQRKPNAIADRLLDQCSRLDPLAQSPTASSWTARQAVGQPTVAVAVASIRSRHVLSRRRGN